MMELINTILRILLLFIFLPLAVSCVCSFFVAFLWFMGSKTVDRFYSWAFEFEPYNPVFIFAGIGLSNMLHMSGLYELVEDVLEDERNKESNIRCWFENNM